MAIRIVKASEPIKKSRIKALIYGEPGIGKTTFGLTAPSPLLLDIDDGIDRVDPLFRRDYIPISKWEDMLEVLDSPDLNIKENYQTLVPDTVGKALDLLATYIIGKNYKLGTTNGALTQQGWGVLKEEFRGYLRRVSDLGLNIVFIAHDREQMDGDRKVIRPDIAGRSLGNIIREMDLVGYMQSRQDKRTISFNPSDTFYGKNTCGIEPIVSVPNLHDSKTSPLSQIFEKYDDVIATQNEVNKNYNVILELITETIDKVVDEKTALEAIDVFAKMESIWDSKAIARITFRAKTDELGIVYDPKNKIFTKMKKVAKKVEKPSPKKETTPKADPKKKPVKKEVVKEDPKGTSKKDQAKAFVEKGKAFSKKGGKPNFIKAIRLYEEAYALSPEMYIKGMVSRLLKKL